jgi:antitoxin ParD1/3/4
MLISLAQALWAFEGERDGFFVVMFAPNCSAILVGIGWICLETGKVAKMARNTSVTIGDHFAAFISEQVQAGRYGSTSDVVRAGLRLLEEYEARIKALEAALVEGEESGEPQPFDNEVFKARMRAEYGH